MRVAIVGSGRLALAVQDRLACNDVDVKLFSRTTGFDVLSCDAERGVGDVEVIIEATDIRTQQATVARDFFVGSTKAVNAMARRANAKHILISIVGCARSDLAGNGYYAGKAAQERLALAEHSRLTVVRSTTWHEFARQNLERFKVGPLAFVPTMTIRPIALDAVAEAVAECAVGERSGTSYDLVGPEVTTLWKMTKQLGEKRALMIPLMVPGEAGRAMRQGALLPQSEFEIIGPNFSDWIAADSSAHSNTGNQSRRAPR